MNKNKRKIYCDEKILSIPFCIMFGIGIFLLVFFTYLKLTDPDNWAPYGYLMTLGFIFFFLLINFACYYFSTLKPYIKFKKYKELLLSKGVKVNGEIIESKSRPIVYTNGVPTKYIYTFKVKLDNGTTIEANDILMPATDFEKDVSVYCYNDKYFVTDFKYIEDEARTKRRKKEAKARVLENDFTPLTMPESIISLAFGVIFVVIMLSLFSKAADLFTMIILIPFIIAGIGVCLQGLLGIIMSDKIKARKISTRVYLVGFLSYWFLILLIGLFVSIRDGNLKMALFTIPFFIVGFYIIKRYFFNKK